MRILITGGAGFIGSNLCTRMIEEGHHVTCLDNFITSDMDNIKHLTGNPNFKFMKNDVNEYIQIEDELDYILHFATPASPIAYMNNPIQTLKAGALGTHNCLGLAKKKHAKFLLASTSEVYGNPLINPQPESYWGNVNPVGPRAVYDESKRFAEAITMAYHDYHKIDTRIARFFNTYGPMMRPDDGRVVSNFINQSIRSKPLTVYGDGTQTRSFCYISDLLEGILKLMESDYHEPVNLGNPDEKSILELTQKILELTNGHSDIIYKPLPINDPKLRCPDISLAKEILGWSPEVTLEKGLQATIDYFKNIKDKWNDLDV